MTDGLSNPIFSMVLIKTFHITFWRLSRALGLVVFVVLWAGTAGAMDVGTRPRLFLSCAGECFADYLRQELSYFDFARDPHLADFTVVVARQVAGGGGERFTATLVRRGVQSTRPSEASFVVEAGTTAHAARDRLVQLLLSLLHRELTGTPHERSFELRLPRRSGDALSMLADPWDYWVVAPELRGEAEGGSGYYFAELECALTLRRITERSKVRVRSGYTRNLSGYRLEDGSRVRGDVYAWDARALYAHSMGKRWALGGIVTTRANEYENIRHHVHGGPVIELNVFPYAENASRQVRFAYQAGAWANWYFEENRRERMSELRPYHALSMVVDANQPWGSMQWVNQVNEFLDAPRLYRVSTGAQVILRLFRGFAVSLEGTASLVRDLISLRERPVTDRELLLWTAQQPTNYLFELELALSYTFGSVHNTIVNPRFGRVDLEKE